MKTYFKTTVLFPEQLNYSVNPLLNPQIPYHVNSSNIAYFALILYNILLTAAAIEIVKTTDPRLWVLLAFTVGVWGQSFPLGQLRELLPCR